MNKAVFLDRDGVINDTKGLYYVSRKEDFFLREGITDLLASLQSRDYLLFVVTNQGGVSKGEYTLEDVREVHHYMVSLLDENEIFLSGIYVCPHHDSIEKCLCRKPEPLLIERAISAYGIDAGSSWFIGDRETDIQAGKMAGVQTILVTEETDLRSLSDQIR